MMNDFAIAIFLARLALYGSAAFAADTRDIFAPLVDAPAAALKPSSANIPEPTVITVKASVHTAGDRIYLSDLAECSGDVRTCGEASGIDFGLAPKPGGFVVLSTKGLAARIAAELGDGRAQVDGPEDVRLEADYVTVDAAVIKERFLAAIQPLNDAGHYRIEVVQLRLTGERKVRPGDFQLRFLLLEEQGNKDLQWALTRIHGHSRLEVAITSEHGNGEIVVVQLQCAVWVNALVAQRDLSPDSLIPADAVGTSWRKPSSASVPWLTDPREIEGKVLKRAVRTGDPIYANLLSRPILVRRGQAVTLLLKSGTLTVTSRAKAMDAGGMGDTIEVQNGETKKKLLGRITEAGTVEVAL